MEQITELITQEIERRVNERITHVLEKISATYDIPMRQLLRDMSAIEKRQGHAVTTCLGTTAKKQRCSRPGHFNGFCKVHKNQYTEPRVVVPPPTIVTSTIAHTHTLPPLFQAGCPACERSRGLTSQLRI